MKWTTFTVALIAALALSMAGCGGTKTEQTQAERDAAGIEKQGDETVANVNGTDITVREVSQETALLRQQMGGRVSPEQIQAMEQMLREQALTNLVNRLLLMQAADSEGITATSEEIEERYREIRANFPSEEEFVNQLARSSMTVDQLRREIGRGMRLEEFLTAKTAHLGEASEGEAREYYESNSERFTRQERVRASHVLIMVGEDDAESVRRQKRERIEEIHKRLLAGEKIDAIAAAESDCPSSENGGDLGFFGRGQMVKPFEDAAFALPVGGISPIVETRFGYHVIKAVDREAGGVMPFDEIREGIVDYLTEKHKQEAIEQLVTDLRAGATISFADSTRGPDM